MSQPIPSASPALAALIERAVARVRHALPADAPWPEGVEHPLARVALASDFVVDTLARQPALLAHLAQPDPPPLPVPRLDPAQPQEWAAQLRRYRAAASARLVWRDVLGLDDVDATLAGATTLAETCLQCALQALEQQFSTRHGQVIAEDGSVQRLVVFGLGKLGGGELNFSSDVDLVYAYPQAGQSDGARPLAAEEYFARLGQQLARLLDETTADGFSHRVDLRLRPFGSAGRVALSFNGMDQYFQREGRDWERYAWLKARAVAGDIAAGEAWLETLRPFVYRRYLDFTALDGLRDMKAAITAEVAHHARLDDIKRGPGGIREIEFLAQSLQLIRGGREASLRERRLLPALQALVDLGQIDPPTGQALADAYRFLRRVENRLQMLRDAQTHALPQGEPERERIALGLGYAHWQALLEALAPHRTRLDRVMPALLHAAIRATQPDAALRRVLGLLQATLRRTSYLALLDEQPSALARLVDVLSRSALLAERLAAYPLLLDELLDTRISGPLPDRAALHTACVDTLQIDDTEAALRELNERRLALSFRIALATLDGRQQPVDSTQQLAWLAEAVVQTVLQLARRELVAAHGQVPGGAFAIIGYGSLGGLELGFGSDLDLVFLYDHPREVEASDGKRPLEAGRWFARLAQKVMTLLGAETGAGRLYDIDVRLRPDGGKGALVSSLASYRDYQRDRAWTWEHQALVRARAVAGDAALCEAFVQVRRETLTRVRDPALLHEDVRKMRARMRSELDRSDAGRLDLKQGAGGLVDLEFLLQAGVLGQAAQHPALLLACATPALIDALVQVQWLPAESAAPLHHAHATLVEAGLSCTLDRRPRLVVSTPPIRDACQIVAAIADAQQLRFQPGKGA